MLKKITSIICVVLGIVAIVIGTTIAAEPANHSVEDNTYRYSATDIDLPYAAFGADFYTDIYEGSDYIVDVLDEINKSMETVVKAENGIYEATAANIEATDDLINTIYKVAGIIVIAIGLMILAYGIGNVGIAFTKIAPIPTPAVTVAAIEDEIKEEMASESNPSEEN